MNITRSQVIDLLNPGSSRKPLAVRWSKKSRGFFVENLFTVDCEELDDLLAVLEEGWSSFLFTSNFLFCTHFFLTRSNIEYLRHAKSISGLPSYERLFFAQPHNSERSHHIWIAGRRGGIYIQTRQNQFCGFGGQRNDEKD